MISSNLTQPVKPIVYKLAKDDSRKICSFIIPDNKVGSLQLEIKKHNNGFGYNFITELKNKFGKLLGFEEFAFFENAKNISGLYIKVNEEYQRKGYNLGEILRLSSIIEIIENKIKNFNIVSKSTAIYFHSKYKFEPNISVFKQRDYFLQKIAENNNEDFKSFSAKAKKIISGVNSDSSPEAQRAYCKETNKLLKEYLRKIISEKAQKQYPFDTPLEMTLTDKSILDNKKFFNDLFNKHGINYTI